MKSSAPTPAAYFASLPPSRREPLDAVRRVIRDNLDPILQEHMQYGVVAYCVPHSVWAHGHHTRPELPLMYMGLSSQKNDMVVYMLMLLHNPRERAWFDTAWKATGRTSRLEVTGMGCCLRFRKVEDLSLDVIAQAIRRMPVKKYLEDHTAMLARIGKAPGAMRTKHVEGSSTRASAKKRTLRKKAVTKRTSTR
jgi:hypothetical protein